MCYSAQARQDFRKYQRETGGKLGIEAFIRLFWNRKEKGSPYRVPKAMEDAFLREDSPETSEIRELILAFRAEEASRATVLSHGNSYPLFTNPMLGLDHGDGDCERIPRANDIEPLMLALASAP